MGQHGYQSQCASNSVREDAQRRANMRCATRPYVPEAAMMSMWVLG